MLRSSRALVLLGVVLGVVTAATPAGSVDAERRAVSTTVVIKSLDHWTYDESKDQYTVPGVVRSPRPVCERNRLVKVVTPTTKLSDRSNRAGKWSVRLPIEHAVGGTYKATAARKAVRKNGRTIVCAKAVDRYVLNEG